MKLIVEKTEKLAGKALSPSSKSHTVRALLLALLARGRSKLFNALNSEDAQAAIQICKDLSAGLNIKTNATGGLDITVESNGLPLKAKTTKFYTMNSGITTTFAMPLLGLCAPGENALTLDCGEQMKKRPLASIIQAVNNLGMKAETQICSCPVLLSGNLQGGVTEVDGQNSQYLSALLLSLPCAVQDSEVRVKDLKERPYVEMTLYWLQEQNIQYFHSRENDWDIFKIPGKQSYKPFTKTIPGDFSSASYLILAAALVPGKVVIEGLDMNDPQGDKKLLSLLEEMGAKISYGQEIVIEGGFPLKGMAIDCSDIPDLVPTLAVLGTYAEGKTLLQNAGHARMKETDRLQSMAEGLRKMGAKVEEKSDAIIIHKSALQFAKVHGYNDHRTIMALAVAGLVSEGGVEIDTAEGIKKTFPHFVETMKRIGAFMHTL